MKTKRILAASTAALLAFGSTAAYVASAAETTSTTAKTDDYTLELVPGTYQTDVQGKTTAHITASLKSGDIAGLLIPANTTVAANKVPALDGYTEASAVTGNLVTAAANGKYSWINAATAAGAGTATTPTDIAINGGITQGAQLIKWKDADADPATYETETTIVALGNMEDSVNPYANLAMGLSVQKVISYTDKSGNPKTYNLTADDSFKMTNITLSADVAGKGTDLVYSSAGKEEKADQTRTAKGTATFEDIQGGTAPKGLYTPTGNTTHLTTGAKGLNLSFGLNGTKILDKIDAANSSFTVSFDIELDNDKWEILAQAAGVTWDDTGSGSWSNININDLLNKSGDKIIASFLGIEGTSLVEWATETAGGSSNLQVGSIKITSLGKTVATNVKTGEDTKKDNTNYFANGVNQTASDPISYSFYTIDVPVTVNYGITKQNVFKNLNAGGTVTFEFDKEFRAQDSFNPYLMFRTSGGLINPPIHLEYVATSSDNKSITFSFPDGLTWDEKTTNPMKNFEFDYNLGYINTLAAQANSGAYLAGSGYDSDTYKSYFHMKDAGHLVKITFKAEGAPASSTSGSTKPGTSGSNSGSSTASPNTGIALAIAPVVLAAGAVAVVALKKKH